MTMPPESSTPPESTEIIVVPQAPPENRRAAWRRPASVIAAVALALLAWQWLETRERLTGMQTELAKRLLDSDAVAKESQIVARNTQEAEVALQAKVALLEAQLAEVQGQQAAFDTLYKEFSRTGDDRLLAEIEREVAIAAQQLRLAGDVQAALIALSDAEARLARAARPQFAPLRQMIAHDIERLKALPEADVPRLTQKLETLIAGVDALPLAYERHPKAEPVKTEETASTGFWQSLAADFWQELRGLVRVERIDSSQADPGLLSPSQSVFVRENLKLRLGYARLALMIRDGRAFHEDVRQAGLWLERYFDGSVQPVQTALATLRGMQEASVGAELPALSETLDAVRNFKVARSGK
ncbi:MAG: uroporphyrinogen-III C-methyltransferase [Zoogloeaceae bacterium]|jgi:uroporphyrin-3 C-methyltransferase|nr:uroporphyrinogen-III C-methyltransferase [Zoogloeaceae bacterium]